MAVKMEGMSSRVVVVKDYLYDCIVFQDVRVAVDAVDGSVVGEFTGRESSIEGWDFRSNVCDFVKERTIIASQLRCSCPEGWNAY